VTLIFSAASFASLYFKAFAAASVSDSSFIAASFSTLSFSIASAADFYTSPSLSASNCFSLLSTSSIDVESGPHRDSSPLT
jgi:hypothetical protein